MNEALNAADQIQQTILLEQHGSLKYGFYLKPETPDFFRFVINNKFSIFASIKNKLVGYFLFHEIADLARTNLIHYNKIRATLSHLGATEKSGIYIAGIAVDRAANLEYRGIGKKLYSSAVGQLKASGKKFMIYEIALNPPNNHSLQFFTQKGAQKVDSYTNAAGVEWGIFITYL